MDVEILKTAINKWKKRKNLVYVSSIYLRTWAQSTRGLTTVHKAGQEYCQSEQACHVFWGVGFWSPN
jgi:hypothetical protein